MESKKKRKNNGLASEAPFQSSAKTLCPKFCWLWQPCGCIRAVPTSSAGGRVLQRRLLQLSSPSTWLQPLLRTRPMCTGSPRRQDSVTTQGLEQ